MNINELEKLAREATPGPWVGRNKQGKFGPSNWSGECDSSVSTGSAPIRSGKSTVALAVSEIIHDKDIDQLKFNADFIAAANPAAILELIDSHRKLSDLLSRAFGAIIRDSDGKLLSEAMSALNKANGEINE